VPLAAFTQITPQIFKLNLPLLGGVMWVGVWLVRSDDGWTMIDTGAPRDAETIARATETHLGGQAPARIILTHGHYDHAGSLQALQRRWNVPVLVHRAEIPFVTGQARYGSIQPAWWGYRLFNLVGGRVNRSAPTPVSQALADGDVVAGLVVHHVPGHSPGMIALAHRADRAIIAGDTFVSRGGKLGPPLKIFTPRPAESARSMRKLAGEDFDHLLASHGRPILGNGKPAAAAAATRAGA
jgi:glyoxylase-like metal-dependent hydrolase (beta-lactamase superfamily II)